jgi:hypothetical protein
VVAAAAAKHLLNIARFVCRIRTMCGVIYIYVAQGAAEKHPKGERMMRK